MCVWWGGGGSIGPKIDLAPYPLLFKVANFELFSNQVSSHNTSPFSKPTKVFIYMKYNGRYSFIILLNKIPTSGSDLKVKVMNFKISS